MQSFDAIIIGAGQAGPALAKRLAGAGQRVAIIERQSFGGTCINTGCTPTKTLVASAYAAHMARRAAEFGVVVSGGVSVDMRRVKQRKDAIVASWSAATEASLRATDNCTVCRGHARFVAPHEVEVGGERLGAARVFINVGGRAAVPAIPGIDAVPYLTNTTALELDAVPAHLVIIGGSYIGLEFAQIFRRFGAEVTVLEGAPRLVPREDDEISTAIRGVLESEGIRIVCGVRDLAVAQEQSGVEVSLTDSGSRTSVAGSHLLLAVGRRPNTNDLGLDRAGVATDARGFITVDDRLQTNVPDIWALGDCNGRGAFTHTSWNDFEIVAANLLDGEARTVNDRIAAYALYTDPPLGRAGMTETEARAAGHTVLVGRMAMADVARAIEKGETAGLMKLVVDGATQKILGAAILGTGGDEAIHSVLDLMYAGAPYTVLQRAMHIHPTVCELLPSLAGDLQPVG
ncbi:MAG TPA: FAD-containing oxidoreductase [Acetobacteraceae bacterium]|jgi:pyruvate/2-oxoglutarate dehydrogenase complex dihydrolipoamide dehydrogenase (E3) component|nr:FAD-containing oxidoreductase [Acetobacteraceae bacterium]